MKYMHFNSSCSYAGLANMLAMQGYDTEDFQIALDMGLPYFLGYDTETKYYQAGAMLQSKEWYDLYLKPRGFRYIEKTLNKNELVANMHPGMMLGIQVNPQSRHAVIFQGLKDEKYLFLNNKWEETQEEEQLCFSKEELLGKLPDKVTYGYLQKCECEKVDLLPYFEKSIEVWEQLKQELGQFVRIEHSSQELRVEMNRIFRPLLLDGLTMMRLLEQQEIVAQMEKMQRIFLDAVRSSEDVRLADKFQDNMIEDTIEMILGFITEKKEPLCKENSN